MAPKKRVSIVCGPRKKKKTAAFKGKEKARDDDFVRTQGKSVERLALEAGDRVVDVPGDGDCAFHAVVKALVDGAKREGPRQDSAQIAVAIMDTYFEKYPELVPRRGANISASGLRAIVMWYLFHSTDQFAGDLRDGLRLSAILIAQLTLTKDELPEIAASTHPETGVLDMLHLESLYKSSSFYADDVSIDIVRCLLPVRLIIIDPSKEINTQSRNHLCENSMGVEDVNIIMVRVFIGRNHTPHYKLFQLHDGRSALTRDEVANALSRMHIGAK